jgi:hypothetical protein
MRTASDAPRTSSRKAHPPTSAQDKPKRRTKGKFLFDGAGDFGSPPRAVGKRGFGDEHVIETRAAGVFAISRTRACVPVVVQN